MRKHSIVALVAAGATVAALSLPATAAKKQDKEYRLLAALSGQEETQAADPDGYGAARITVKGNKVCFVILARNVEPITAGHIHRGAVGEAGPIVVDLLGAQAAAGTLTLPPRDSGCVTASSRALAKEIAKHPGRFYVNLHNATFPNGAIRGQLTR